MEQPPDLSHYRLWTLIGIADRMIDDAVDAGVATAGFGDLRRSHGVVFEMLDPAGSRITDLARRARMTKQGMGQLVADLEALGYVERRPDPADGRAKLVALTARGRAAVAAGVAALTDLETRWAWHLGKGRARELHAALADVCAAFGREHIR
jgi:DNA-binding MarR family transcriptional regulator